MPWLSREVPTGNVWLGRCRNQCAERDAVLQESARLLKESERYAKQSESLLQASEYSAEEIAYKVEVDADEAGLEIYARSGFRLPDVTNMLVRLESMGDEFQTCTDPSAPRGDFWHPETCWRVHNLRREIKAHQSEYEAFAKNAWVNVIPGPSLLEAQEEVRAYLKAHPEARLPAPE